LGLASAACWGAGDFCGGLASKRTHVYSVIITSQIVGVGLLIGLAFAFGEAVPAPDQLALGGAAGFAGTIGLLALYRALATGRMGVAAPIAAIVGAALPVLVGFSIDGLPSGLQLIGFAVALLAVWLITQAPDAALRLRELTLPLVAGLAFGVFFVLIGTVKEGFVFWPLVAARCTSLGALWITATLSHQPRLADRAHWRLVALVGIMEVGGNAFFVLAGQTGRLDVAAVISSLYPATTVWLAWVILKERLSRQQLMGVAAALAAIVLISI
jgi:drug/metabolite transporter (DMT)-like permease